MSNTYIVTPEDIALGDMEKIARKRIAFNNHLRHYCAVTIQCYMRRWYAQKVFKKMVVTARNTNTQEVEALQMEVIEAIPIPELDDDNESESSSDSDEENNEEEDIPEVDDYRDPTSRVHANNILDEYDNDDLSYLRTKLRQLNLLQRTGVIDKLMMKKRQEELLRRHNF
jgi:hypothetical protein